MRSDLLVFEFKAFTFPWRTTTILMNIKLSVFPVGAIPGEFVFKFNKFHEKNGKTHSSTYFAQNQKCIHNSYFID